MGYYEIWQKEKFGDVIPPVPPVDMDDDDRWMEKMEELELIDKENK